MNTTIRNASQMTDRRRAVLSVLEREHVGKARCIGADTLLAKLTDVDGNRLIPNERQLRDDIEALMIVHRVPICGRPAYFIPATAEEAMRESETLMRTLAAISQRAVVLREAVVWERTAQATIFDGIGPAMAEGESRRFLEGRART